MTFDLRIRLAGPVVLLGLLALGCGVGAEGSDERFMPDPIDCPDGAEPKLFEFSETRIGNRQPLSAVGWRCFAPDGRRHGPSKEWFANGQVSSVTSWWMGEKHGKFEMWHPNGQKRVEGEHDHWNAVGVWTSWDDQGAVLAVRDFGREGRPGGEKALSEGSATQERDEEPEESASDPG